MKPLTQEWIEKGEGDFHTAQREMRARKQANYDSACFHSQQCVEKYIKAGLQEEGKRFPYTHDLAILINLIAKIRPLWGGYLQAADQLTQYAVTMRYPGVSASRDDAKQAFATCKEIRVFARHDLGLKS